LSGIFELNTDARSRAVNVPRDKEASALLSNGFEPMPQPGLFLADVRLLEGPRRRTG
jgi:hypothetical protein